jgi:flagellar basal-body rod protein FlgF
MESGMYAAYSGLLARTQALDLAANNLANAGVTGFRAGRESFSGAMADAADTMASQVGGAVNSFGVLGGSMLSNVQGTLNSTGNPLDLAIGGTGFFAVQSPNGTRYTRDGEFKLSADGTLQTASGWAVLDASGQPITVPTGQIVVGSDGSLSVSSAEGSAIAAQVGVYDLGSKGAVSAEGANIYKAAAGVTPTLATDSVVHQGSLEASNQDTVAGTVQLLSIQRQAEMMQRALSVFHNDFDKTSTEELARV